MTTTPVPGTPTQVAHPWRAVLRTLVAAGVGVVVAWVARTLGVDLTDLTPEIVDSITGVVWLLVTGLVQWLLTRPAVEAWLRRYAPGLATGVHLEASAKVNSDELVHRLDDSIYDALDFARQQGYDDDLIEVAARVRDKVLGALHA